jgi:hypothetical protein
MIRQLPKKFTPSMFLQLMIERGFEGLFDFLHLARATSTNEGPGCSAGAVRYRPHGFVTFIAPEHALRCRDSLDGQSLNNTNRFIRVQPLSSGFIHDLHNDAGAPWKCPACGGMNLQWWLACYSKTCCPVVVSVPRTEGTGSSSSSRCLSWTGKPLLELQADP